MILLLSCTIILIFFYTRLYNNNADATTLNSSRVLHLVSEQFGTESVAVTLEWQDMLHDIHVHVVPEPLTNIGNLTVQLVVPYNVPHLVKSVSTLCGRNTTDVITLHYGQTNNNIYIRSRIAFFTIILLIIIIIHS